MRVQLKNFGLTILLSLVLTGCGGGGGGGSIGSSQPPTQQPPPTLVQDILPTGPRLDVRDKNLFPLAQGDSWTYRKLNESGQQIGLIQQTVGTVGATIPVTESDSQGSSTTTQFRKTADGITQVLLDPELPQGLLSTVGSLLVYAEPFYSVGSQRLLRRAGAIGADLNGDGISEGFRFEYGQIFRGFESLSVAGKTVEVARFTNIISLTLFSSNPFDLPIARIYTEDTYFASNFGLVKSVGGLTTASGEPIEPKVTLLLERAVVGGQVLDAFQTINGEARRLSLMHNALVYDRIRNVYYASVPNSSPVSPSSIAVIDPTSGATNYVALPGAGPGPLALALDGNSIYVGFDGTSEVVRLGLPAMNVLNRVSMPKHSIFNTSNIAENISVSPTEPNTIAISLASTTSSPVHDGVILVKGTVVQPRKTQTHTGSNEIVFSADGAKIFGLNTESSESGLRSISVLADGLQQTLVIQATPPVAPTISVSGNRVFVGGFAYSVNDLSPAGQLPAESCSADVKTVYCFQTVDRFGVRGSSYTRILMFNPTTLEATNSATYALDPPNTGVTRARATSGPTNQVAISQLVSDAGPFTRKYNSIVLFTSDRVP